MRAARVVAPALAAVPPSQRNDPPWCNPRAHPRAHPPANRLRRPSPARATIVRAAPSLRDSLPKARAVISHSAKLPSSSGLSPIRTFRNEAFGSCLLWRILRLGAFALREVFAIGLSRAFARRGFWHFGAFALRGAFADRLVQKRRCKYSEKSKVDSSCPGPACSLCSPLP